MNTWHITTLLAALASVAFAFEVYRTRRQLAETRRELGEVEGSARILEEERHVLELIARGSTLKEVLEALTQSVENIVPEVLCSVLLVDAERGRLTRGAAPHLPPDYWQMCEGVPIMRDLGCCPSAAFSNETIICQDMAADFRWASIKDKVLAFGLRSCWSEPIRNSETNGVIGTFAMYRAEPSTPTAFHLRAVQAGAQLAGNAIERLRAEQNLREYAARFALAEKVASFGVWEWDEASDLYELSAGTAWMAGFASKPVRVTGPELYETVHPDDREPARVARETVFHEGGSYEHEFRRVRPDGSVRWFRNRGSVELKPGQKKRVIGGILDITEHKELLLKLERAKIAAEEATRSKSAFLANMSHEIRTPMNAVIGMTTLLLDFDLPPDAMDYLRTIRTSSDALLAILNDILDFSKIESGKLDLERVPFCLREALEDAAELLAAKAMEKGVEMAVDINPKLGDWVYGDPSRLRQIIVNLIGNAVKFTSQGEVAVTAREVSRSGRREIAISVRDTGIGIPSDKLDRLFQTFSQVDSSITRRFGGTGLGLAISKRLAEIMSGSLAVTSVEGAGSTFTLTLPFESAPSLELPPMAQANWAGKRALVVDDNATNRLVLDAYLSNWNFLVSAVDSPAAARQRIHAESWDLLIVDWKMPEMTGTELALSVRNELGDKAPPIVIVSSGAGPVGPAASDGRSLFAAQMNKPIRRQNLYRVLAHVLGGKTQPKTTTVSVDPDFARRVPLRVLVADDNLVNQKVAVRLLERWGYRPDVVKNGFEVLDALRRKNYDLVLLDVQMPEMGGIEAAQHICADYPPGRRPKLIALTAGAFKEDRESCLQAGMDGFLSKPLRVEDLRAALESCASSSLLAVS